MRISSGIGLLGSAVAMAAVLASGLAQAQETDMIAPHQHAPASIVRIHDGGTADSTNWSGYAVTGANDSVTSVTGSWIVPASTCTKGSSPEYSAFWIGIDGWTSKTVEQIGTDSDCRNGKPSYYAWYEFYPEPSYYATGMTNLTPGDTISATVSWAKDTKAFTLTITDETADLTFTKSFIPVLPRARSSAEWIAEAPSNSKGVLPLADFGTVYFGQDYTSIASGFARTECTHRRVPARRCPQVRSRSRKRAAFHPIESPPTGDRPKGPSAADISWPQPCSGQGQVFPVRCRSG